MSSAAIVSGSSREESMPSWDPYSTSFPLSLWRTSLISLCWALRQPFLKHHSKAEEATIEVRTPQHLSQLGGSSPHQSPMKAGQLQRELIPSFAARMKLQQGGRATSKSKKKGRDHRHDDMD